LLHLCRYIHLNPVKTGLVDLPEQWLYSNYSEWIGERSDSITDTTFMIRNFGNPEKYREFVEGYWAEKQCRRLLPGIYLMNDLRVLPPPGGRYPA